MKKVKVANKSYGSKHWANSLLRFAIRTLKGEIEVSSIKGRISTALYIRKTLLEEGFWWQAKIINFWIHLARRSDFKTFTPRRGDPSTKEKGSINLDRDLNRDRDLDRKRGISN